MFYLCGHIHLKNRGLHERRVCHYCYFFKINFTYQASVCGGCNDLLHKSTSFNDVRIAEIEKTDYRIHFWYMTKSEALKNELFS